MHPLFTHVPIFGGWPEWNSFFATQQVLLTKKGEQNAAVFLVSGYEHVLSGVAVAVDELSSLMSPFQFHVEVEQTIYA